MHDANDAIDSLISLFDEPILVMGFGASRVESKDKLLFKHVANSFAFVEFTTLINVDALVIFGQVFGDVLVKPFSKPGNGRCL
jgi:hypothetical protein